MLPLFIILAGAAGIYLLAKNSEAAPAAGDASNPSSTTDATSNPGGGGGGPTSINVPDIDQTGASKNTTANPSESTEPTSEAPPTPTTPPTESVPNDSVYPFVAVATNVKGTNGIPVQLFVSRSEDSAQKVVDMTRVSYALNQYVNAVKLDSKNGIVAYRATLSPTNIPDTSEGPANSLANVTKAATAPGAGFYVFFIKDWGLFLDHPIATHEGLPNEIFAYTASRAAVGNLATPDSGLAAVVFPEDLA